MSEIRSVVNTSLRHFDVLFYNKNTSVIPYEIYDLNDIIVIFAIMHLSFRLKSLNKMRYYDPLRYYAWDFKLCDLKKSLAKNGTREVVGDR